MHYSNVCVFKEITTHTNSWYLWFRLATDNEEGYITPEALLSEDEHNQRLSAD
jgi:hypothetical protein